MTHVESRNPATGEVVYRAPALERGALNALVQRAAEAQPAWAATDPGKRAAALHRFAELIDGDRELEAMIVAEVGKLRREAEAEVHWAAVTARWYADRPPAAQRAGSALVLPRPVGLVAIVSPWNVPLITPAWKFLPALMAGNSVIWKPSSVATGVAALTTQRLHAAGVPEGVIEHAPGSGRIGEALCRDPHVGAVHFTGSTSVGRSIAQAVASRFVPYSLEMGGSNPAIVFDDADVELAADCIADTVGALQGQKCTTTRRVIVHERLAPALIERLRARFEAFVPGDPADPCTTLGPLISPEAAAQARRVVERSIALGARVLAQTPMAGVGDCFFPATLLGALAEHDPLNREELFAPVVAVSTFIADEQAWARANDTPYGLTAAVYTNDPARQRAASQRLRVGGLAINRRSDYAELEAPFGGAKDSGHGAPDGGEYVYASVCELQAVYAA